MMIWIIKIILLTNQFLINYRKAQKRILALKQWIFLKLDANWDVLHFSKFIVKTKDLSKIVQEVEWKRTLTGDKRNNLIGTSFLSCDTRSPNKTYGSVFFLNFDFYFYFKDIKVKLEISTSNPADVSSINSRTVDFSMRRCNIRTSAKQYRNILLKKNWSVPVQSRTIQAPESVVNSFWKN